MSYNKCHTKIVVQENGIEEIVTVRHGLVYPNLSGIIPWKCDVNRTLFQLLKVRKTVIIALSPAIGNQEKFLDKHS